MSFYAWWLFGFASGWAVVVTIALLGKLGFWEA